MSRILHAHHPALALSVSITWTGQPHRLSVSAASVPFLPAGDEGADGGDGDAHAALDGQGVGVAWDVEEGDFAQSAVRIVASWGEVVWIGGLVLERWWWCCERYRRGRLLRLVIVMGFMAFPVFFPAQTQAFIKDEIAGEAAGVAAEPHVRALLYAGPADGVVLELAPPSGQHVSPVPADLEDRRTAFGLPASGSDVESVDAVDVFDCVAVSMGEGFERVVPSAAGHAEVEDVIRVSGLD